MNKVLVCLTTYLLFLMSPFALAEDSYDFSGRIRSFYRWQERLNQEDLEQLRASFRLDGMVNLDDEGCYKLRGRVSSGSNYNSEWETTGLGEGEGALHLNLRHLYIDMTCLHEKIQLEVGALRVDGTGGLGLTDNGWIDGMRITFFEREGRKWDFTIGEKDELTTTSVFKRSLSRPNNTKIHVTQNIGKDQVFASISHFEDRLYTRAVVTKALKHYLKWLSNFKTEILFSNSHELARVFQLTFNTSNWEYRLLHADIDPLPGEAEKFTFLLRNFLGYGRNNYIEADRQLKRNWIFTLRAREGDAGKSIEFGLTKKFNHRKK